MDSTSRSPRDLILGGVLVLVIATIGLRFGGLSLIVDLLGLGDEAQLTLTGPEANETIRWRVALPPTEGEIDLLLDPVEGAEIQGATTVPDEPGTYRVETCRTGCQVSIDLRQPFVEGTLSIEYLAGDSDYLDEIELDQVG